MEIDRARRNGMWLGGVMGVVVAFVAMATVGLLVEPPRWLGVNVAWFALAGASIGRSYAGASAPAATSDD